MRWRQRGDVSKILKMRKLKFLSPVLDNVPLFGHQWHMHDLWCRATLDLAKKKRDLQSRDLSD